MVLGATDYTLVTRNAKRGTRSHKALPVSAAREALGEVAQRIGPFLSAALGGGGALALMESGFMVTRPGAEAQAFHRDVAPGVVSASSLAASLQVALVDTCAEQGVLEVRLSARGSPLWMPWQLLPGLPLGVEMQGPPLVWRERRLPGLWPCPLGEPRLAPLRPHGA